MSEVECLYSRRTWWVEFKFELCWCCSNLVDFFRLNQMFYYLLLPCICMLIWINGKNWNNEFLMYFQINIIWCTLAEMFTIMATAHIHMQYSDHLKPCCYESKWFVAITINRYNHNHRHPSIHISLHLHSSYVYVYIYKSPPPPVPHIEFEFITWLSKLANTKMLITI